MIGSNVIGSLPILLCTQLPRVQWALQTHLCPPCWFYLAPRRVSAGTRLFKRESLQSLGSRTADFHLKPLLETSMPNGTRPQCVCVEGTSSRSRQKLHLQLFRWAQMIWKNCHSASKALAEGPKVLMMPDLRRGQMVSTAENDGLGGPTSLPHCQQEHLAGRVQCASTLQG